MAIIFEVASNYRLQESPKKSITIQVYRLPMAGWCEPCHPDDGLRSETLSLSVVVAAAANGLLEA